MLQFQGGRSVFLISFSNQKTAGFFLKKGEMENNVFFLLVFHQFKHNQPLTKNSGWYTMKKQFPGIALVLKSRVSGVSA